MSICNSRVSVPPIGSGEARVHLFRRYSLISTRQIPRQIPSTHAHADEERRLSFRPPCAADSTAGYSLGSVRPQVRDL